MEVSCFIPFPFPFPFPFPLKCIRLTNLLRFLRLCFFTAIFFLCYPSLQLCFNTHSLFDICFILSYISSYFLSRYSHFSFLVITIIFIHILLIFTSHTLLQHSSLHTATTPCIFFPLRFLSSQSSFCNALSPLPPQATITC